MQALVFGVEPENTPVADAQNPLLVGLSRTPTRLMEIPRPKPLLPDWAVVRSRLTGICGSDSKQIFGDFGNTQGSALGAWFSLPQVLGHECVGTVEELGPKARGLRVGQRVVLNPWLTCAPRGVAEPCAACRRGDLTMCHSFSIGPISPGIHTGTSKDASGGYADFFPAHDSMLFPVPDAIPDEVAVFADPFAVSLHSITRNPPPPNGKVLIWGAGALGTCANAIVHALYPTVDVAVVARFQTQKELAHKLGASLVIDSGDRRAVLEEVVRWSGGRIVPSAMGMPMALPGGVDVVYDTVGKAETLEIGARVLRERGTLVQSGVHGADRWDTSPLYFKELHLTGSNAFGIETVDGVRKHGIQHYLDLVSAGRIDLSGMLTHTYRLEQWREALVALAEQDRSGAIKVAFDFR